jgi:tripartite-type tricarboxylate transporter receptor subunit TctC
MKKLGILFAAAVATVLAAAPAQAQSFPTHTVKLAVPFPAGGGTDLLARVIAEALGKKWGHSVIVENLSGAASGNVGSLEVARAAPDGYTLLLSPPGPITLNKLLYKNMPFDSSKWVPISVVASVPYVIAVRKDFGASNVKELIAKAKANPGKITYASPGVGTVGHLGAKQFEMRAGVEMVTVPYKGLAPALKDIVGGHVDLIFDTGTTSLPLHNNKQVDIIATCSPTRWPGLPDVPTVAEAGLPGFRAVTWYGIVAPGGTPPAIAAKISADVEAVIKDPDVAKSIQTKLRMDPIGSSAAEAAKLFADDATLWGEVIKNAKITLD